MGSSCSPPWWVSTVGVRWREVGGGEGEKEGEREGEGGIEREGEGGRERGIRREIEREGKMECV